jgi:hypothetical protein
MVLDGLRSITAIVRTAFLLVKGFASAAIRRYGTTIRHHLPPE